MSIIPVMIITPRVRLLATMMVLAAPSNLALGNQESDLFWTDALHRQRTRKSPASQHRMDWWRDARFGMFIHWNISSVVGCEISWSKQFYDDTGEHALPNPRPPISDTVPEVKTNFGWAMPQVPRDVYDNLQKSFYPGMFDADQIVATAKNAGMKYIIQIAKHHDGFSMWDTKYSDFNVMHTPFKRDIIAEMAAACQRADMKFGIYYSQRDWHHPDYGKNQAKYNEFMRNQVGELLRQHPNIAVVWFDAIDPWHTKEVWEAEKMFKEIHAIRPDIIINNRCGVPGDFYTPEQQIGNIDLTSDWESCMTFTGSWSWHGFGNKLIPYEECLRHLVACAGGNGNLLMNIGPMPTGQIDPREANRLRRVGKWLDKNGDAIYGTTAGPYRPAKNLFSTRKDNKIFLHVVNWGDTPLVVAAPPVEIKSARLLAGGPVTMTRGDGELTFTANLASKDAAVTVIELTAAQPTAAMELIHFHAQ